MLKKKVFVWKLSLVNIFVSYYYLKKKLTIIPGGPEFPILPGDPGGPKL